jgi:hypothetical protein
MCRVAHQQDVKVTTNAMFLSGKVLSVAEKREIERLTDIRMTVSRGCTGLTYAVSDVDVLEEFSDVLELISG